MISKFSNIVIIGGGPAGVSAAISAVNSGAKDVMIIEREPYGRHRIGEILLTQTIIDLVDLGIADEVSEYAKKYQWGRKFAAAYVHGQDRTPWKVQNNHPIASELDQPHIPRSFIDPDTKLWYTLMVRRHEFDEALREIAIKKGVKIIHGEITNINIIAEENKDHSTISFLEGKTLTGEDFKIYPNFIVDATGQQAFIPRKLKARHVIDDWNLQSKYTYFKNVDFENAINNGLFKEGANILSYEDGWVWVANLGKGQTSIGIVSKNWDNDKNSFWNKLKNLPEYHTFGLDKATVVDYKGEPIEEKHFYSHPNYRYRSETLRGKNWACCGDAAMFLDPLLSQGVTLAISFGTQLGKIAHLVSSGELDAIPTLIEYEKSYISELEVLNKVVTQWYQPNFNFTDNWVVAAEKISNIFGRTIGKDVEAFRWISNLENIHHIQSTDNDLSFLKKIDNVNSIKMIHDFEKYDIL